MRIGFDAKRAFHNTRGLGNYSRDTIRLLSQFFPDNQYFLFNPKKSDLQLFHLENNMSEILPDSLFGKMIPSLWRSTGITKQIASLDLDIYHGLSQELPLNIGRAASKKIVTMHDAIFMRFPELYPPSYRSIFIGKNRYACQKADRIIAISEQTKRDLIHYFDADEEKIDVVYQGCNPLFLTRPTDQEKELVREKYALPKEYILTVGAIEKRKNVELILKALHLHRIDLPLVIIGKSTSYMHTLISLIETYGLTNQVHFLHQVQTADLPAIYSLSKLFVFPSIFEGFGIPILEALYTETPVIASTGTCFEEVGGESSFYIDPNDADKWGKTIETIVNNPQLQAKMKNDGLCFAKRFSDENIANNLINIYLK